MSPIEEWMKEAEELYMKPEIMRNRHFTKAAMNDMRLDSEIKYRRISDGAVLNRYLDGRYYLTQCEPEKELIDAHDEWEKLDIPCTWKEAMYALEDGKNVICEYEGVISLIESYNLVDTTELRTTFGGTISAEMLLHGQWAIADIYEIR